MQPYLRIQLSLRLFHMSLRNVNCLCVSVLIMAASPAKTADRDVIGGHAKRALYYALLLLLGDVERVS